MSRIMMMTSATAALLVSASALAWGWSAGTRLTLVTSDGARIIGVGGVNEGEVEITVERGFQGYAVLMVEGPDGTLEAFDVVVEEGGNIVVGAGGNFSNLSDSTSRAGLRYRLTIDDGSGATEVAERRAVAAEPETLVVNQSELEALGLAELARSGEASGQEIATKARSLGEESSVAEPVDLEVDEVEDSRGSQ